MCLVCYIFAQTETQGILLLSSLVFAVGDFRQRRSKSRSRIIQWITHRITLMAASAIDLDVSMDFEPDDNDSSFDDENFNPNQKVSKKVASGGVKVAVDVAVARSKTTKPPAAHQKTIEQTYQKKTQLEVRRQPPLLFLVDNSLPLCLA